MRHVLIGGSGFVGRYLTETLLNRGAEVLVFDQAAPPITPAGKAAYVTGDVRAAADLARIGLRSDDIVHHLAARQFHLAVPNRGQDAWFADVNVGGTAALLDAMRAAGTGQLIFLSTDMVYGRPDFVPVTCVHPLRPLGPYGRSKLAAEALIADWRGTGGRASVFRPRMISGPGRLGILGKLFGLIDRNLPVPMIGSGNNRYQMIAVQDCVDAMLAAADKGLLEGPFNLGSDNPPLVKDLLRALVRHAGSRSPVVPTPGGPLKLVLAALGRIGRPLLHPEQYLIADVNYLLDTAQTTAALDWRPLRSDGDMLTGAYDAYCAARKGGQDPT
jgi:dTDP-glucose 4,6-dehydratase